MENKCLSRREFLGRASIIAAASATMGFDLPDISSIGKEHPKEIVSIARIKDGNIAGAVEEAIDLLGGIRQVTKGRHRIILKPNLVTESPDCTTKPVVVGTIAKLMKSNGKEVSIAEGSAAAYSFNANDKDVFRTKKKDILDAMQKHVFDTLGYTEMAVSLDIPLINLHSGDIVEVPLNNGLAAKSVRIHKAVADADLVCSVPMMKTHSLATITLSMKNLIGLYPGTEYYSVRSWLHDRAAEKGSPGVAYEVIDMNNAVRTGLSVIDASTAMQGNGPMDGTLVNMGLIVAGTSPLSTDMVGALLMGFDLNEIPAIVMAHKTGMLPVSIDDIEIRGLPVERCARKFVRPNISKWTEISSFWGAREI